MNLSNLHENIGTAKDNRYSPIHDWYRFTAGFSYKLVDKIINEEKLGASDCIHESFAGCGTTLVSAQKCGVRAVGNEGQELLYNVIKAKLNWSLDSSIIEEFIQELDLKIQRDFYREPYHELLKTLYTDADLIQLYIIRDFISCSTVDQEVKDFLNLALTQTLHRVSIHPIAVPYISRTKFLKNSLSALEVFKQTAYKMLQDLVPVKDIKLTSKIFWHDSRRVNKSIENDSCSIAITSPPYLNNLDYGEVSKVCSHFFGYTNTWQEITEKVRKNLVTGATTHYKESDFDLDTWMTGGFYLRNKKLIDDIMPDVKKIEQLSKERKGRKSFHILALYYFEDMFEVLIEMKRVLRNGSKAFLVLGDSAPYGVYIDTTEILGKLALEAGFGSYKSFRIRNRGAKWPTLTYRHKVPLSEKILVLEL